jgi:hypothetical protein
VFVCIGTLASQNAWLAAATMALVGLGVLFAGVVSSVATSLTLDHDPAGEDQLIEALRRDLVDDEGRANASAIRMIWTGDHLDGARRLQATLVGPARAALGRAAAN